MSEEDKQDNYIQLLFFKELITIMNDEFQEGPQRERKRKKKVKTMKHKI